MPQLTYEMIYKQKAARNALNACAPICNYSGPSYSPGSRSVSSGSYQSTSGSSNSDSSEDSSQLSDWRLNLHDHSRAEPEEQKRMVNHFLEKARYEEKLREIVLRDTVAPSAHASAEEPVKPAQLGGHALRLLRPSATGPIDTFSNNLDFEETTIKDVQDWSEIYGPAEAHRSNGGGLLNADRGSEQPESRWNAEDIRAIKQMEEDAAEWAEELAQIGRQEREEETLQRLYRYYH